MTDTEIFEELKLIIHKQFDISKEEIDEESYFDEDLHISELDMDDFISTIQAKYNIAVDDKHISRFKQVSDLVTYLYEKLSQTI